MKKIKLSRGKFALVDDEDFEELNKHKWYCAGKGVYLYAVRWITISKNKQFLLSMHRVITNAIGRKQKVDHIDHNTLNNQKDNLRVCTHSQNMRNRKPHKNGSSKYKGVSWENKRQKWRCIIKINGKNKHLGYFDSEVIAAETYNKSCLENYGEFAFLNTI